jgi:hypothetical protein
VNIDQLKIQGSIEKLEGEMRRRMTAIRQSPAMNFAAETPCQGRAMRVADIPYETKDIREALNEIDQLAVELISLQRQLRK